MAGSSGAAYIFIRNSLGNWVQTQKLVPAGTAEGFGSSVAIDEGMIIVGASQGTSNRSSIRRTITGPAARRMYSCPWRDAISSCYATEGLVFTYTREGSTVLARGIASNHFESNSNNISMALANNWLLVGHLGGQRCFNGCPGDAKIYDVNRFRQ